MLDIETLKDVYGSVHPPIYQNISFFLSGFTAKVYFSLTLTWVDRLCSTSFSLQGPKLKMQLPFWTSCGREKRDFQTHRKAL